MQILDKRNIYKIHNLCSTLESCKLKEQKKPKARRKDIIKMRVEILEVENRETPEKRQSLVSEVGDIGADTMTSQTSDQIVWKTLSSQM